MLTRHRIALRQKTGRGFSLIELMIALAIMGLLIALGVPAFGNWIRDIKVRSAAESFTATLQQARAEAIRSNTTVFYQLTDSLTSSCGISPSGTNWVISLCPAAGKCDQGVNRSAQRKDYKCDAAAADGTQLPLILAKSRLEGNEVAQIASTSANWQGSLCFSGLGRVNPSATLCSGTNNFTASSFKITNGTDSDCIDQGGKVRCMRVDISVGGEIRLCDPAVTDAKDPRKC